MLKTALWALLAALNIFLIIMGVRNIGNGIEDGNVLLVLFGLVEIGVGAWKFDEPFKEGLK